MNASPLFSFRGFAPALVSWGVAPIESNSRTFGQIDLPGGKRGTGTLSTPLLAKLGAIGRHSEGVHPPGQENYYAVRRVVSVQGPLVSLWDKLLKPSF